jgi:hypothetical protein
MDIEMIERMVTAANDAAEDYDECCTGIMMLAAIKAMREPTNKMTTQGYQFLLEDSSKNGYGDRSDDEKIKRMRGFYTAMINAIIGDK